MIEMVISYELTSKDKLELQFMKIISVVLIYESQ